MTEDQFIERVGEELHGMTPEGDSNDDCWTEDRPLWGQPPFVAGKGYALNPGPSLSQLLRAIYRVLQEGKA